MKDVLVGTGYVFGTAGVIASFVAASWPAWILVKSTNSALAKATMKVLAASGCFGWWMIFVKAGKGFGMKEDMAIFLGSVMLLAVLRLLYQASLRGEDIARRDGVIDNDSHRVFYKKRQ